MPATPVRWASTTKSAGSSVRRTASETWNTSNSKYTNSQKSTARNHYDLLSETVEEPKKGFAYWMQTRENKMVVGGGFGPPKAWPVDLQSTAFDRSATPPKTALGAGRGNRTLTISLEG